MKNEADVDLGLTLNGSFTGGLPIDSYARPSMINSVSGPLTLPRDSRGRLIKFVYKRKVWLAINRLLSIMVLWRAIMRHSVVDEDVLLELYGGRING
ncbi:hypothetical protein KSS87_012778 [Heliosperma pusillum]|nr:hypothetical protein KSS87_012778 [Heliosperma pusillum]